MRNCRGLVVYKNVNIDFCTPIPLFLCVEFDICVYFSMFFILLYIISLNEKENKKRKKKV